MNKVFILFALSMMHFTSAAQHISVEQEVSMLALGDSYTIGQSVDIPGRWPHQFMDELRKLGASGMYPDYIATTGWTTGRLIQAMNDKMDEDKSYNLVSILIGVNNQYQGISIATYEPDLRTIIDKALDLVGQNRYKVFILSIPDYAYTPFGGGNERISEEIDAYNNIKRRVAGEYGIPFVDITPISREGLDNPSLVASDRLHPSEIQYRRWVEAILPRVRINQALSGDETGGYSESDVRIYPNPTGSTVVIDAPEDISRIRLLNATGILVYDQQIKVLPVKLDLSGFEPGMLSLWLDFENNEKVVRSILLVE